MTENEKLFVEVARELKKLLDNKNTMSGTGEVSLRGYFPEALWNKLHFKAGHLSGVMEAEQAYKAAREQADSVENRLRLELNTLKVQVAALSSMVEGVQQPNCKPSYDKLLERVENLEDEGAFQNHVEAALVNIMEAAVATDDFANFHRKFAALLKYHFGKLARSQP